MDKLKKWVIGGAAFAAALAAALGVAGYVYRNEIKEFFFPTYKGETFTVANWNLQVFGTSKAGNQELMKFYAEKIKRNDITFVQEIRDSSDTAFSKLCSMINGYEHKLSSRAGRSNIKEQYGVIFKKGIKIKEFRDFNPDAMNRWERPPIKVTFEIGKYSLTAYNIHTKPQDTKNEIRNLQGITEDKGNVMVLGDLNASGSYYKRQKFNDFSNWLWVIKDDDDTTVAASRNAYDRIILNRDAQRELLEKGIDTNVTKDVSDHYLVWARIAAQER